MCDDAGWGALTKPRNQRMTIPVSKLHRVISGGQTGTDQAALEAAKEAGLKTGGVCPNNFMTTAGPMPELGEKYGLRALARKTSLATAYATRTRCNVDESDATLVFRLKSSRGTEKTIQYATTGRWRGRGKGESAKDYYTADVYANGCTYTESYRPLHVIIGVETQGERDEAVARICRFVRKYQVATLNVAGHRGEIDPNVKQVLVEAFTALKAG